MNYDPFNDPADFFMEALEFHNDHLGLALRENLSFPRFLFCFLVVISNFFCNSLSLLLQFQIKNQFDLVTFILESIGN